MEYKIWDPVDAHVHLRQGEILNRVVGFTRDQFAAALVMPNLVEPIKSVLQLKNYKDEIEAVQSWKTSSFLPMMTLYFDVGYDYTFLETVKPYIHAVKLYPKGMTTHSDAGVDITDLKAYEPVLKAMEELDIPLCVHAEQPGFVLDREKMAMLVVADWAKKYPKLRIVVEHVTDATTLKWVEDLPNVWATITIHHLYITLDDVIGGQMRPHNFCKPVAKRESDRQALIKAAISGSPKYMLGTDSAPHPKTSKETCGCAAGCFTAPYALKLLAEAFYRAGSADMQVFVSENAKKFYRLSMERVKLVKLVRTEETEEIESEVVEAELAHWHSGYMGVQCVVPFMAREKVPKWNMEVWDTPNDKR